MKNYKIFVHYLKTFIFLIIIICILKNSESAFNYAYSGLTQWALKMVPTLFPFMMISSIMVYCGADIELGKILTILFKKILLYSNYGLYAVFMGFLCGFPMGAKVVCELYKNNKINKNEAQLLLGFCNNIGPSYFIGIIIPILYNNGIKNIYPFLFGMYGIPMLYGIILSYFFVSRNRYDTIQYLNILNKDNSENTLKISAILKKSCFENTQSLILLGGYITFTNAFRIVLNYVPLNGDYKIIASCFIEIISGIQSVNMILIDSNTKIFWIMTALCFGGISCILQTGCFLEDCGLSILNYLKHKFVITIISALYYYLILFY